MYRQSGLRERIRELFEYRFLILNLVKRDLKVRYKNSVLGVAWSMLNPLGMMLVFTVVFTVLAGGMDVGSPPVFILAGLLPWNFFAGTLSIATQSLVGNAHLIKKVYFPREILPLSVMLSNLVHFLLAMPIYFLFAIIMHVPSVEGGSYIPVILWLPVIILLEAILVLGLSLITSTINVFYRDMGIVMETLILAWFFVTPVFYDFEKTFSASTHVLGIEIPVSRIAFILNPMASIIAAFRDTVYYGRPIAIDFMIRTAITAIIALVVGYWVFMRMNWRFGEEL
ncbi:MAG: ABC transporter permease [Chloroflexota bacterium]